MVQDYFTEGHKKCIPRHKNQWTVKGLHKCLSIHPKISAGVFTLMDTDGDGVLDFKEVSEAPARCEMGAWRRVTLAI